MASFMPLEHREGNIWLDGHIVAWSDAHLHVLSHGLHYASAVWEGLRSYDGHIFKLQEHIERLFYSAAALDISLPFSVAEINAACLEVVSLEKINNGYIRPIVWRGGETLGVEGHEAKIHLAIAAWELSNFYGADAKEKGIRLTISPWKRPPPDTGPWDCKIASLYAICSLAKRKARNEGYDDALIIDWRGYIAEATSANIFMVINGELHTPIADCFLKGITRQTVFELANSRNIPIVERILIPQDLATADEVFITGTAAEVTPVYQIEQYYFNIGKITRQLMSDYKALVSQRLYASNNIEAADATQNNEGVFHSQCLIL